MTYVRRLKRGLACAALAGTAMLCAAPVLAQTVWTGTVSTDWATAGNWSAGAPGAGSSVQINSTPTNIATVQGAGRTAANVSLAAGAGQTGTLIVTGSGTTLATTPNGLFLVGDVGTGVLTVSAGASLTTQITSIGNNVGAIGTATVTGANSLWTVNYPYFKVGDSGTGTLDVLAGGRVTTGFSLDVGSDNGASGDVLVSGTNSRLQAGTVNIGTSANGTSTATSVGEVQVSDAGVLAATGTVNVGYLGQGTLNVDTGADVTAAQLTIASKAKGDATFNGAGTTATITNFLSVGVNSGGIGTLKVENGAVVTSMNGAIGTNTGASGTVTVTGTDSRWSMTSALAIGQSSASGTGSLNIAAGGRVDALNFTGYNSAVVDLDGNDTQLNLLGSSATSTTFTLGATGANNTLDVTGGADLVTRRAVLTTAAGTGMTTTIDGTGTTWTATGITLGGAGTSSTTISSGAQVTSNGEFIVDGAGTSTASLTINGASVIQDADVNSGQFRLGVDGDASLLIENGGTLESRSTAFIGFTFLGRNAGSTATATVTGAGSTWTADGLFLVGSEGEATLDILDGGALHGDGSATIASFTGSKGTVRVSGAGSEWVITPPVGDFGGGIRIGVGGEGELIIEDGAYVQNAGGIGVGSSFHAFGAPPDGRVFGTGKLTVTGAGTKVDLNLDSFQSFDAGGDGGTGTIDVLDGAVVTVVGQGHFGQSINYSDETPQQYLGSGTLRVNGAGSKVTYTQTLDIGEHATGILNIEAGGFVSNSDGYLGSWVNNVGSAGVGTATVTGAGSIWQNSGTLMVGDEGRGTLNVLAGGLVTNTAATIGRDTGSIGTATVSGAGSTWTSTGTLRVGNNGTGTLTVAAGGAVGASGVTIGALGTLNLGSGGAAGTLTTPTIANGGAMALNHTGSLSLGANISGVGTLTKSGAGTTTLTGTNTYTGATSLNAGTLYVNGAFASTVTVASGATLGGTGVTIAVANVLSGGSFAPGNSIGTMTVATADFASGSFFDVEINPTAADLLTVTGTATVNSGAVVRVAVATPGTYAPGSEWQILDAMALNGGFSAGVIDDSAFLDFTLDQTTRPNEVWLQLIGVSSLIPVGETPNQIATAGALQSLGTTHPLVAPILPLNADEALVAFDQLSGEVHASVARALIEDSRLPREAALDRIDAAFKAISSSHDAFWSRELWARAVGTGGIIAGDGNAAAIGYGTGGLIVGADGRIGEHLFLGFEGGFTQHSIGVVDRSSSASVSGYHFGMYGGAAFEGLRAKFGAAWSGYGVSTTRTPTFPSFAQTLNANYWAGTAQAFAELGYAFALERITIEPFVRGALLHHSAMGYAETGGTAALTGNVDTNVSGLITLGLRGESEIVLGDELVAKATGLIGVQREVGANPTTTHAFDGSTPFTVMAPGFGTGVVAEAGLSIDLSSQSTLSLMTRGGFGSGAAAGGVSATFAGKF
jgi:T5SS/PEP-CTERM-associated repeat protein